MNSTGSPALESAVRNFETTRSVRLPDDYRRFLLSGCEPRQRVFSIESAANEDAVAEFMNIDAASDGSIQYALRLYGTRLPPHLVPIAYTESGNLVCIAVDEDEFGTVYFWDHELELTGAPFFVVADSFTQFVASLRDDTAS